MLEINDDIYILNEDEVSVKRVFNCFFKMDGNIIYVVNKKNFVGIITSGEFLKHLSKKNTVYINRFCSMLVLDEKQDTEKILKKAELLFQKKHITTAIPVLNQKKEICYEIREKKEISFQKMHIEFYDKLKKYENSYYVHNEIEYLRRVLESQDIIVIGTENQFEDICGKLILNRNKVSFIGELDDAYTFMHKNRHLLIDVSIKGEMARKDIYKICCVGYDWEEFLHTVMYVIECEYGSRFYQTICTNNNIAKEYLEKYWDKEVLVPQKGIFASGIRDYLGKLSFKLKDSTSICKDEKFCIKYYTNGMICNVRFEKDLMVLDYIDQLIQFFYLNIQLNKYHVSVLNFVYDAIAYMTDDERVRLEKNLGFHDYVSNIQKNQGIGKSIYKGYTRDKIGLIELESSLFFHQVKRFENDLIVYKDYKSRLVNIENGIRKTCYQPEEYQGTIYFLGPCTIYGLYVEDKYTIPSIVQQYINMSGAKYRVINLGNQIQVRGCRLIESLNISENDIFVFFFHSVVETISKNISVIELGTLFNKLRKNKYPNMECFLDGVHHCGDNANTIYAEIMYCELKKYLYSVNEKKNEKNSIYNVFRKNTMDLDTLYEWEAYKKELVDKKKDFFDSKKIGCIVMNCNPFTKGHRYLVEYAMKIVDYLYVFVVEEDKSLFSFIDRYKMAKDGLCDLENVEVIRSGNFIISSVTFPAYFRKDKIKNQENVLVNQDLRVFAQYIAYELKIRYRFVGEEPHDYVTNQYNIAMKEVLPQFGIEIFEIPRRYIEGEIISASTVRKYYQEGAFNNMRKLVPKTTLDFLLKKKKG